MARGNYHCVHCGQRCSVLGHLRRETLARPICPSTRPVTVIREADVAMGRVGFCCPPGHVCEFAIQRFQTARERRSWRGDRPTFKQVEYLRSLGYLGPDPKTKGQAHDLIEEYIGKAVVYGDGRTIKLRKERHHE
jgi:hypothetical protein